MRSLRTLRTRFALWATILILLLLFSFGAFVYFNLSGSLHRSIDEALSLSADQTAASLDVENGHIAVPEANSQDEIGGEALAKRGLTLIVFSADGTIIHSVGPFQNYPVAVFGVREQGTFLNEQIGEDQVRLYVLPILENNQPIGWVETLRSQESTEESLSALLAAIMIGIAFAALLAGGLAYFLAARTLAPIDNITQAARNISVNDLGARLKLIDNGDEVSRLANTFNEMLERLEEGFKRERQFTANASHELRTPVAAMEAILSVVREGKRPAQEYKQAFEDLAEENDRLKRLIDELLNLARGEGDIQLNIESFDLSLLLNDLADAVRPLASAKRLTITLRVPSKLVIKADRDLLIRLFMNILDNAIKYTEKGGVEISALAEQETVAIKVRDTGQGIAPEHLPHIFERFYRADEARSSKGTGLGLAIAYQIATAHGGSLKAESVLGQGSTFTVELKR